MLPVAVHAGPPSSVRISSSAALLAAVLAASSTGSACRRSPADSRADVHGTIDTAPSPPVGFPVTVRGANGESITLTSPPRRIVSLAPSNTEILYALGLGERVAGDTTACDYPPAARDRPHVGGFSIEPEAVEALNPDLVVAVSSIEPRAVEALDRAGAHVLVVDATDIRSTLDSILLIGRATGTESRADQIVHEMRSTFDRLRALPPIVPAPRVLIAYSENPIYTTGPGSFIDDVIRVAGGRNVVDRPLPGNVISSEAVIAAQPAVIICSRSLMPRLSALPGWTQSVPAVRRRRFFQPSDPETLERPGPRLARAADELAAYLRSSVSPRG